MKLTQKQLASLAKVSTPTISRFEQAEKDLQLSSVLAIFDVLGMTDRRTLAFAEPEYTTESEGVTFWGHDGKARVRCRISREALDDHFSRATGCGRMRHSRGTDPRSRRSRAASISLIAASLTAWY